MQTMYRDTARENVVEEKVASVSTCVFSRDGGMDERSQWVVREQPVTLYLNGHELVTLLCAGHHLDELGVGFFHSEGFLKSPEDLKRLKVDESAGRIDVTTTDNDSLQNRLWLKRTVTSGCGKGSVFYHAIDALLARPVQSSLQIKAQQIFERIEELNRMSETYRRTHGVHNCALASPERILLFRDDIGRHNAVDMIVGYGFLQGVSLEDKLLITTGRLTSEILIKAAKVKIPVLVSRNTATTLAIEIARTLNITLIGYARAGKFTVYSGEGRVLRE
jgi:FdhD protein